MKRSTLIAIGIAVVLCLCVSIACIGGSIYLGNQTKDMINEDPAKALAEAKKITDFDMPPGFEARTSMSMLGMYDIVILSGSSSSQMIMFMQTNIATVDKAQLQEQMERSMQQQSGQSNMEVVDTYQRTIRGEETTVVISEGTRSNYGSKLRQLMTTFSGNKGTAIVVITGPIDSWDEDMINAFLDSFK